MTKLKSLKLRKTDAFSFHAPTCVFQWPTGFFCTNYTEQQLDIYSTHILKGGFFSMRTLKAQLFFSNIWGKEKVPLINCSEVDFNGPWHIYFNRGSVFVGEVKEKSENSPTLIWSKTSYFYCLVPIQMRGITFLICFANRKVVKNAQICQSKQIRNLSCQNNNNIHTKMKA